MIRRLLDYNHEAALVAHDGAPGSSPPARRVVPFQNAALTDELTELDLASSFLDAVDTRQVDRFVGLLIDRIGAAGPRHALAAIRPHLQSVAKLAGQAVHTGTESEASIGLFGSELEGLSNEDQEFEIARRYVRFALAAIGAATAVPAAAPDVPLRWAARQHAPGLLPSLPAKPPRGLRGRLTSRRPSHPPR